MSLETCWTILFSSLWTIFWFFPRWWMNMYIMSGQSCNGSWRTCFLSKLRNASSMHPLAGFICRLPWATMSPGKVTKCQPLQPGPSLRIRNNCNTFWALPTFITTSFIATALWLFPLQPWLPPSFWKLWRHVSPMLLFYMSLTLNDSLLLKWMPPTWGWGSCCLKILHLTRSLTHVLSSLAACRTELWHWKPSIAGSHTSFGGMAALAGGSQSSISCLDGSWKNVVHSHCKTPKFTWSPLVTLFHAVQLLSILLPWVAECQAWCFVMSVSYGQFPR